jgi:S-adenosylmethionine-diacylglycerol 3-amino-3-carboxypropyl transferase
MIARTTLPTAVRDRLFFAQVREDPRAEIAALAPAAGETMVVVSSGGCTALSLLAAGAGRVVAVDLNRTQNHLVELKAAACRLGAHDAIAFLGARPSATRAATYAALRESLSPSACHYWDTRQRHIEAGVLGAGVSERFIGAVVTALTLAVHPRSRIDRLLACRTLAEQRTLFANEWDTRRWRALFALLCNRLVLRHTYPREFFAQVENPSFALHFRRCAEHALTDLPAHSNYFLHQMLTGSYPADEPDGVPPYLSPEGAEMIAAAGASGTDDADRLHLIDGGMTEYLRSRPDASVHGFALSNICEWMTAPEIDALFREVMRTAAPGARLVYRNFVDWTELPAWCERIVPDEALGARLSREDRSVVQRRVVACRVEGEAA